MACFQPLSREVCYKDLEECTVALTNQQPRKKRHPPCCFNYRDQGVCQIQGQRTKNLICVLVTSMLA